MAKNKGDMVYIPASVTLYQFDEGWNYESNNAGVWAPCGSGVVKRYRKTQKPMNALCVGEYDNGYKQVIYESERWLVRNKDVYAARKGD